MNIFNLLRRIYAVIPIGLCVFVIVIHGMFSIFGGLSPWKGGGFGMYTAAHPSNRIVWLASADQPAIRLLPQLSADELERTGIDDLGKWREVVDAAYELRPFPADRRAKRVICKAFKINNMAEYDRALSVVVFQIEYSLANSELSRHEIFTSKSVSRQACNSGLSL